MNAAVASSEVAEVPAVETMQDSLVERLLKDALSLTVVTALPQVLARVRGLLLIAGVGAAVFGGVLGLYRGGLQTLYATIKLPMLVLLTAAITTAALVGFSQAIGRSMAPKRLALMVMVAWARSCIVLAATAPIMSLALVFEMSYHRSVLLAVGCCGLAGLAGVVTLVAGLAQERRGLWHLVAATLVVVVVAGTQLSWVLRPYLVRPKETGTPFLRALDGSFSSSVSDSLNSANGVYKSERDYE